MNSTTRNAQESLISLASIPGVTGFEHPVQTALQEFYSGLSLTASRDSFGNLFVDRPIGADGGPVLILSHVDEAGFVVNHILDNGLISFAPVGKHIDARTLVAQRLSVSVESGPRVLGVIGTFKLAHLVAGSHQPLGSAPNIRELVLDVGARDSADAHSLGVRKGASITFENAVTSLGDDLLMGSGLAARAGTLAVMKIGERIAEQPEDFSLVLAHTVLREAGHLGARVAASHCRPRLSIVIEAIPADQGVVVAGGPAVRLVEESMDVLHGLVIAPSIRSVIDAAERTAGVTAQRQVYAGNFLTAATEIHMRDSGYLAVAVGIPVRNIHSAGEIVSLSDVEGASRLAMAIARHWVDAA